MQCFFRWLVFAVQLHFWQSFVPPEDGLDQFHGGSEELDGGKVECITVVVLGDALPHVRHLVTAEAMDEGTLLVKAHVVRADGRLFVKESRMVGQAESHLSRGTESREHDVFEIHVGGAEHALVEERNDGHGQDVARSAQMFGEDVERVEARRQVELVVDIPNGHAKNNLAHDLKRIH